MKIFLVGMMGAGKTYVGKEIAKKLKLRWYDLDALVEMHEGKSINDIFDEDGEVYFREVEAKILRWFADNKNFVLSTGGGTPCFHKNMNWMNENGVTLWLDMPIDVIHARLLKEQDTRPLIRGLNPEQLTEFLINRRKQRAPDYYSKAKIHVSRPEATVQQMIKRIKYYYA